MLDAVSWTDILKLTVPLIAGGLLLNAVRPRPTVQRKTGGGIALFYFMLFIAGYLIVVNGWTFADVGAAFQGQG